ncbi:MAG: ATP-binding protein [Acidimicrobiales bacterium]
MTRPAHQATTRQLGAAYPFASEAGLGAEGVLIGRDLLGGAFAFDPFTLYAAGLLTNPNMIVFGQIGRGKSAFVKSYLWRQSVFGRRAWVIDPKGEYGALAAAAGVQALSLRPGGTLRLNPLDAPEGDGPDDAGGDEAGRRRAELLVSLAAASLGRNLEPAERTAVELAVVRASELRQGSPVLSDVVEALLDPCAAAAQIVRTDRAGLAADGRAVALELRRLVAGDLRGMFDGPTTPGVALDGPMVVLDLSAVYHSPALGLLMTCAASWLHAALRTHRSGARREPVILVVDEAWAILSNLAVARWLQSSWKMSRAWGVANVAVLHRVSDLVAAGDAGSEQSLVAQGLLADSETQVLYGQPPGEATAAAALLDLSATEQQLLTRTGRGVALWKVGRRSFLVQHCLAEGERSIVDTDAAMACTA